MTATVNASTSAGVIVTSDTSGALALQTAGTTALTISSGQYVTLANGISNGLNVSGAGWGVLPYTANSTVIDNNSGQTRIFATGANTTTYGTLLSYAGTTNGSATLVTTVGKDLTFALQGATQSSGIGIAFPATQSASSNANTLDDYEEGTWTPQFTQPDTLAPGVTYVIQVANYTKVGTLVHVQGYVAMTSKGTASGGLRFANLPFPNTNTSNCYAAPLFGAFSGFTGVATMYTMFGDFSPNQTNMTLYYTNGTGAGTALTWTNATNSTGLEFSFTYQST